MIVVKIELHPKGDSKKARLLGTIAISNDGTSNQVSLGNYNYALSHAGIFIGKRKEPFKKGRVTNFLRKLSPYRLLYRVLKDAKET